MVLHRLSGALIHQRCVSFVGQLKLNDNARVVFVAKRVAPAGQGKKKREAETLFGDKLRCPSQESLGYLALQTSQYFQVLYEGKMHKDSGWSYGQMDSVLIGITRTPWKVFIFRSTSDFVGFCGCRLLRACVTVMLCLYSYIYIYIFFFIL